MTKCIIYDFETLGQQPKTDAVLSLAVLDYDDDEFIQGGGYTYEDLLDTTKYIKFDVADQVKNHGRLINEGTLDWWKSQGETAKKVLKPSLEDLSISTLLVWLTDHYAPFKQYGKVYTRGNTFDPIFLAELIGHDPFPWWAIRDTRSYIDALLLGDTTGLDNRFVPAEYASKFVAHDARHDIVMDVMRMQVLTRAILL